MQGRDGDIGRCRIGPVCCDGDEGLHTGFVVKNSMHVTQLSYLLAIPGTGFTSEYSLVSTDDPEKEPTGVQMPDVVLCSPRGRNISLDTF